MGELKEEHPGSGNSMYKGSEAGTCLAYLGGERTREKGGR